MPNEAYRRRMEEWEKKQRERREAVNETPYDPEDMPGRIPLGCTLILIVALIIVGVLVIRFLRIGG